MEFWTRGRRVYYGKVLLASMYASLRPQSMTATWAPFKQQRLHREAENGATDERRVTC